MQKIKNRVCVTKDVFVDISKKCFIRMMKNVNLFPSLYRLNRNYINNNNAWCHFPTIIDNPLCCIVYPSNGDFAKRPQLHVRTHVPQEEYDKIVAVVNNAIKTLIENNPYAKRKRVDYAKLGEDLFNQIGFNLYGNVFLEDMRALDSEMEKNGMCNPPKSKEEFDEFMRQAKEEYKAYYETNDDVISFGEFVQQKMGQGF